MRTVAEERRTRRSARADEALLFQLERVRDEAQLDALVLATAEGLPVAHSGEDELCVELAALAPFLHGERAEHGEAANDTGTTRVRAMTVTDFPLLLVSYRRDAPVENDGWLEHASRGIERILAI
jgi:hypothetical protein